MNAKIQHIQEKKLVGKRMTMSFANYTIGTLWQSFMPQRKHIANTCSDGMYSLAIYPPDFFTRFNPSTLFERWAAVEVNNFDTIPAGMETTIVCGGLYAVFHYKGLHTDNSIFQYILQTWLPASGYQLDNRPHFEWLGEKYSNNDPESEEEIWVPIK